MTGIDVDDWRDACIGGFTATGTQSQADLEPSACNTVYQAIDETRKNVLALIESCSRDPPDLSGLTPGHWQTSDANPTCEGAFDALENLADQVGEALGEAIGTAMGLLEECVDGLGGPWLPPTTQSVGVLTAADAGCGAAKEAIVQAIAAAMQAVEAARQWLEGVELPKTPQLPSGPEPPDLPDLGDVT
jgi:hypothetical protein